MEEHSLNNEHEPEVGTNQTRFAEEEPLFSDPSVPRQPVPQSVPVTSPSPVKLIVGAVMALMVVVLAVLVFMPRRTAPTVIPDVSPLPSPTPVVSDLQPRLDELTQDLKKADPSKLDLPFPPVQPDISLDSLR